MRWSLLSRSRIAPTSSSPDFDALIAIPTSGSTNCCRIGGRGDEEHQDLIEDGGEITVGKIGGIDCGATAADGHNCLAMLVRREGETLNALLRRLDKAIASVWDGADHIDEVNC